MSDVALKYRTFDELLDEAATDLHTFNLEGMIEPAQLFKVVLKINKELGLKINQTKQCMIEVDHRKAKLPADFYAANFALLCGKFTVTAPVLSGRHTENIQIDTTNDGISPVVEIVSNCAGGVCSEYKVIEQVKYQTRTFTEVLPLQLSRSPLISDEFQQMVLTADSSRWVGYNDESQIALTNLDRFHRDPESFRAQITDTHIRTKFEHGRIFLSYEGNLVDDDNNLLCLDHPIINEYYEYALKSRILENLYLNGEDTEKKMLFIDEKRLKPARTNALSIAYTPDFAELKKTHESNRKAMYKKYYNIFR
jgi:hypothetical protein